MAKVTVYVNDEQLAKLKRAKAHKGGVSKAFQAFLDTTLSAAGLGGSGSGRYDYARKLMPLCSALDAHRERLASKVAEGGPPADGGPVATALTLLLFQELLKRDPDLRSALDKEYARFGLDELVQSELGDLNLTVPPPSEVEEDDEEGEGGPSDWAGFGLGFAHDVNEALREAGLAGGARGRRRHRDRRIEITVDAGDDPRECLTVKDFERFTQRHPDWESGQRLTPSQVESVIDLLRERAEKDAE